MAEGFFSKNTKGLKLDMTTVLVTLVITLVVLQLFDFVFGNALGIEIKIGPLFVAMAVGIASVLGVAIVKKLIQNQPVSRQDLFAIVVVMMLAFLIMFFLREFVPELFSGAVLELQSMIGM